MLVPRFALSQTDKDVVVAVKMPYVRVGDAELFVVSVSCLRPGRGAVDLPALGPDGMALKPQHRRARSLRFTASPTYSNCTSPISSGAARRKKAATAARCTMPIW